MPASESNRMERIFIFLFLCTCNKTQDRKLDVQWFQQKDRLQMQVTLIQKTDGQQQTGKMEGKKRKKEEEERFKQFISEGK